MTQKTQAIAPLVMGFWRLLAWNMSDQETLTFLKHCLELGITDTDHADIYGQYECEQAFGRALKLQPSIRNRIKIITKCGICPALEKKGLAGKANHYNASKAHIIDSAQQSLKHFNTDRLDTLLIHRPDYLMDADEVAEAFNTLHKNGDVLHFGVSNFNATQLSLLQAKVDLPLVTNQIECSVYKMGALDNGILDQCQTLGIQPMCWSPLAGGKLFAKDDEKALRIRAALSQVGEEIGATSTDQVAYAWLRTLPTQPAIVLGTGNISRVQGAKAALDLVLSREQWYRIWQSSTGHSVP